MTNEDLKELFEEKFKRVYAEISSNAEIAQQMLNQILEQTKKTNGRVNKLEEETANLKLKENNHILSCPQAPKIDKINEELMEYRILKKYPKLIPYIIIVIVIIGFATIYKFFM